MVLFFFNDTATTEIYTLSLHDALPIYLEALDEAEGDQHHGEEEQDRDRRPQADLHAGDGLPVSEERHRFRDRKSTRLNSSHANISYAVFCLKKKKTHLSYPCTTRKYPL